MSHLERSPLSAHVYGSEPRLDSILSRPALTVPNRDGIVFQSETWSYAEIHGRTRRLAGALAALGVSKEHRVAFWMNNRPEFLEILFGVLMLTAVASPLDYWWTWKHAFMALEQIRPKVLIVGASQGAAISGQRDDLQAVDMNASCALTNVRTGKHTALTTYKRPKQFHVFEELPALALAR